MEDGHVRRLPSGGWVADFRVNGKRRQLKGKTKAEAAARMKQALQPSELPAARRAVSGFTMKEARRLSIATRWAGLACETNASNYSQQVVDYFGPDLPIEAITTDDFVRMRQHFLAKGNKPATVNWKATTLQSMLADALQYGHIKVVPKLPKRLKMDNTKDRVLEDQELVAFCTYLQAIGQDEAAHLLVFLCEVGCRFSEAERLTGRDIDLQANRVTFWKTKNQKARTTPLTARAVDAVRPFLPAIRSHRVWQLGYRQFQHQFDKTKAAVGLAHDEELTIHTCRHTCATRLVRSGASLLQVMQWGGWRSLNAVQRYAHVDLQALEAAAKLVQCDPCGGQNPLQKTLATDLQLNLYAQSGSQY